MMRLWSIKRVLLAALMLALVQSAGAAKPAAAETLTIGLIPELNVFKQMERFRPLGAYLSRETGVEIRFTILSRYGNLVESFQRDGMDGAFFGSFTGALAIEQLGVVPLARPVNLDGESTYHGVIYARKDSGIRDFADMRDKKFAFVEKATTAGYVYPLAYLRENGVESLDNHFAEYFFAGSHDATIYAVLDGKADLGASKNSVFDWVRAADPRVDAEIEVLALSGNVPSNGLCVRPDLDPGIRERLKQVLLRLHESAEGRKVLERFNALRFIETSVADYAPVYAWAERAGIDLKHYDYENR
ncbi:phosphate/phosphite/phosphonate ABC transporter substrate-binding protein [Geoalkalibacter halelectricus]|uniref:Phosphate/phosphite/phosphonate ABC transporter substrate-binding protein n=1 Tax=Geoalkalibacter halelectricus TaxID=2847045 RepID=A0ABY5ZIF8_9BACT|nr:phosphate/phosphite/phosphonate ABC transporter substrate-binding protein [Geoalkalibacter halelectricus]UWZ78858.1 phosphate/phosphite/phosphonate ABC transporter substrate-binding protein [Geoalkalibacter halelectricus]